MNSKSTKAKSGPKEDRVKMDMDWESATKKALDKKRPKDGWPKLDKSQEKSK